MKKILVLLTALLFLSGLCLNAQRITLKKGSLSDLKGQKSVLLTYDYSNMSVGKFDKEDDYIAKKIADYNKSEAGKGEKWATSWKGDRATRYEPKFELLFNEVMAKAGMTGSKTVTDAAYEINVHTVFTEPGYNIGVTRKNASIDAVITLKNISTGEALGEVLIEGCPGRDVFGYDFDTGLRIEEAYAKLGKSLAAFILKNTK